MDRQRYFLHPFYLRIPVTITHPFLENIGRKDIYFGLFVLPNISGQAGFQAAMLEEFVSVPVVFRCYLG
jgi:hypothetical protein